MGWTPCWVCDVCSKEFVPEAHLRHLRETASGVIDALSHQGAATFEKAWDELCFLCGRHCEPYLSVVPLHRCMACGGDGKTAQDEPQTCQECAGTGREGGVKGGIEPSSPLPLADVPPSPHGSVFGTDAVCMPPVSAGGMTCPDCDGRGYPVGRSEDKCGFCGGTGHVLRDHK